MSTPYCLFCHHTNPPAAKFCNECGAPLHLKPCRQCEAINDAAAKTCYKCGTADPALVIGPDALAATAAVGPEAFTATAGAEPDVFAATPTVESVATVATGDAHAEREPFSLGDAIETSHDARWDWLADDANTNRAEAKLEPVAYPPQSSATTELSPLSETPDAMAAVVSPSPGASTKRRPKSRVAMAAVPAVLLLGALTVLAYYAFRYPVQLREWLSAARQTVNPSGDGTPTPPVAEATSVSASYAPMASIDIPSVAAMEPAAPRPANEPATDITPSPVRQDSQSATASGTGDVPTPASEQARAAVTSQPQVSTREHETPAAAASPAEKKSSSGTKKIGKKSKKTSTRKAAPARATPSSKGSTEPLLAP